MLVEVLGRGLARALQRVFTLASLGDREPRGNHCLITARLAGPFPAMVELE
jgi:hypothetical protein